VGVSKLVEDDIPRIFAARREGKTLREIAAEFEVSIATIDKVLNRQLWGHVAVDVRVGRGDEMMVERT
jgi:DNA invertase Pin-like site-specific DNA recombinase